jgi:hypothetical protein
MWLVSLRQIDHWTLSPAALVHRAGSNAFVIDAAAGCRKPRAENKPTAL